MTPTSLIIVTDRGSLKAYKVTETPTRGPHLQLVQAFDTTDAHGRYQDKLTDQAGASASRAAPGHVNSIAERTGIDNENDRQIFKQLADSIIDIVHREGKRRLVVRGARFNSFFGRGIAPGGCPRPGGGICEIRSGEDRTGQTGHAFSVVAAVVI